MTSRYAWSMGKVMTHRAKHEPSVHEPDELTDCDISSLSIGYGAAHPT